MTEHDPATPEAVEAAKLKADIATYLQRLRDGLPITVKVKGKAEPQKITAHPETAKLPVMDEDAFAVLVHDIGEHGMQSNVTLIPSARSATKAQVLLGRHRVAAAAVLGIPIEAEVFTGDALEAKAQVVSSDLYRRHMTDAQQAVYVVTELLPEIEAAAAERQRRGTRAPDGVKVPRSSEVASSMVNGAVSSRSIERAKKIVEAPETLADVMAGDIRSVTTAETQAKKELGTSKPRAANGSRTQRRTVSQHLKDSVESAKAAVAGTGALGWRPTQEHMDSWLVLMDEAEAVFAHLREIIEEFHVPSGTAKEILAWVGNDRDRARRALHVENRKPKQRIRLMGDLSMIDQ